jgi:hypothetical protein
VCVCVCVCVCVFVGVCVCGYGVRVWGCVYSICEGWIEVGGVRCVLTVMHSRDHMHSAQSSCRLPLLHRRVMHSRWGV